MMERNCNRNCLKKTWASLDRRILVNQRELLLGLAVCTLAGLVTGMLLSPRKNVNVASNNYSCENYSSDCGENEEDEEDEENEENEE